MIIDGTTRLAGVFGWPVSHSRSPRLHNYWLDLYRINGAYVPLPVHPDHFVAAVRALATLGFAGANVTLPHKEAAFGLCDAIEPSAARARAVNTLVFSADRGIVGSSSDGFGFLAALRAGAPLFDLRRLCAVLLGAGGAARAIAAALIEAGVGEIRIVNRSRERAKALAADLAFPVKVFDWAQGAAALENASLLVNTTSLGMKGEPPLELDLTLLPRTAVVNDIVYAPLETRLLGAARARGNGVIDGLGMLLHQARPGFRHWFGLDPEVTDSLRRHVAADLIAESERG